jgi:cell division protein FtsQ
MDLLPGFGAAEDNSYGTEKRPSMSSSGNGVRPSDMPRVRVSGQKSVRSAQPSRVKIASRLIALFFVLAAALYGFHRLEQFLIRDPRFALSAPGGSSDTPTLEIKGAAHASRRSVERVFADDSGRSVYLIPLADRRVALRSVDWVKDASVARVWPNRVMVQVAERKPVAFVALTSTRFGLIDEDGVILPSVPDRFHLPVLRGVRSSDSLRDRAERVHRMMRLMTDLGAMASKVSEVDTADPDNLKLKQSYESSMITLMLGDQNFATRYKNFVNHYSEIRQKLPGAAVLDLRIEDRITVVEP